MCVCFSHVFLRTDERRSRKRPRLSEVGRVPREFPRLFGKPGLQRHEPGGPRQTERPAGHCQGKLIQSLRVSGARLGFFLYHHRFNLSLLGPDTHYEWLCCSTAVHGEGRELETRREKFTFNATQSTY